MRELRNMFETAKKHLKWPSIILTLENKTQVKVSVAGSKSKYLGQLMVTSPEFGDAYYGRIDQNGTFYPGKENNPAIQKLLADLSNDPANTAAKQGYLTGHCCFCNRSLTDEKSTDVGYGRTCAKNFGLSWGRKTQAA
jgi:Family of unknown function (DUF6011)